MRPRRPSLAQAIAELATEMIRLYLHEEEKKRFGGLGAPVGLAKTGGIQPGFAQAPAQGPFVARFGTSKGYEPPRPSEEKKPDAS